MEVLGEGVCVLAVGGTIDKQYPADKGSYAFTFGLEPAVTRILGRARLPDVRIVKLMSKDSLDMTAADREEVAQACYEIAESRIVITHGTDTMIATARAIAAHQLRKRIILTGAAQPETMKDTDADFNVGAAFLAAKSGNDMSVFIVMTGQIFRYDECEKLEDGRFAKKSRTE